jgi:hypothetical protein
MKVTWNSGRQHRLTTGFILALLFGGGVTPDHTNPNIPGTVHTFDDESLRVVIEEGRRQADRQADTFRHTIDRAQALLTASLVAAGFIGEVLRQITKVKGDRQLVALGFWSASALLVIIGIAAAAATAVVSAEFTTIDTTQISTWEPPVLRELAADYATAVKLGETTLDARVTMFRMATRFVCYGSALGAVAFGLSY